MLTIATFSAGDKFINIEKGHALWHVSVCGVKEYTCKEVYAPTVFRALLFVQALGYADLTNTRIDEITHDCEVLLN